MTFRVVLGLYLLANILSEAFGESLPTANEASFSYGNKNTHAPAQLADFEFLIGEHTCDDVLTSPDGTITRLQGHWSGHYILNGNAIQDHYWNNQYSATNIRVFDPTQNKWLVTYFRYPNYQSGTWEGGKEKDHIVLQRSFQYANQTLLSELVFENISLRGFYWHSSYISTTTNLVNWTSACRRNAPQTR